MQNLDPARILSPFQMKINGIIHMTQLNPPSRLQAPLTPSFENMGIEANGKTVASKDRQQEAAAFAEAAKISYASVR